MPTTGCHAPSYEIIQHTSTTGAPTVVDEGAVKPFVQLNLTHITLPMIKLAANSAVTWETISDYERFISYMGMEMPLQLVSVENSQLLYGTGTSGDLPGMTGFANVCSIPHLRRARFLRLHLFGCGRGVDRAATFGARAGRTGPVHHVAEHLVGDAQVKDTLNRFILLPDPQSGRSHEPLGGTRPGHHTVQCW